MQLTASGDGFIIFREHREGQRMRDVQTERRQFRTDRNDGEGL